MKMPSVFTKKRVAVFVAGSWGTALANNMAKSGHQVTLFSRSEKHVFDMQQSHCNQKYLPDVPLSESLLFTSDLSVAVQEAEVILFAVPSNAMREIATQVAAISSPNVLIIHATKGFEADTLKRMSTVIEEAFEIRGSKSIVVLSGPSHAEEVVRGYPTTVVVASENEHAAREAQDLLSSDAFRVYTNSDVIGLEVAGALKNVVAIGAGISDGLGFGDNAKAALITRGLAEMTRLGVAMGAQSATFAGLGGLGDLVVTCTSRHSRNWRAGNQIGQGQTLEVVLREMGMVVEGVKSTVAAYQLSQKYDVDMPIATELYRILVENKSAKKAVNDLMTRDKTNERMLGQ